VRLWILLTGVALAQGTPGNASLSYEALQKAPAGTWAEYSMTLGQQKASTMRYSLVEKSAKTMAIEIETQMPPLVMRMDFAAAGEGWNLSRIRMRLGEGQVQDVPPPENAGQIIKKGGSFGKPSGSETLKTPAGSFECKKYKLATEQGASEVWMSDKALPTGLVQTVVASLNAKITLNAIGSGAAAKIK
jgi:hypothetical protein